jgi:hypothetical protein
LCSVYINFAGLEDDHITTSDTLGASLTRREQVRALYDSTGLFSAAARRP